MKYVALTITFFLISACGKTDEPIIPVPNEVTQSAEKPEDRIRDRQDRLRNPESDSQATESRNYRIDSPGYETFLTDDGFTVFEGVQREKIINALGKPVASIQQSAANPAYTKEVMIYRPFEEDPTGLYLYLRAGKVEKFRLDEFNGIYGSDLLEWFKNE